MAVFVINRALRLCVYNKLELLNKKIKMAVTPVLVAKFISRHFYSPSFCVNFSTKDWLLVFIGAPYGEAEKCYGNSFKRIKNDVKIYEYLKRLQARAQGRKRGVIVSIHIYIYDKHAHTPTRNECVLSTGGVFFKYTVFNNYFKKTQ